MGSFAFIISLTFLFLPTYFSAGTVGFAGGVSQVDRIFYNAVVYTMDGASSTAEAVAVDGGRIVDVGETSMILGKYNSADMVDLQGHVVIPALVDAHAHLSGFARSLSWLDLVGTGSLEDVLEKVSREAMDVPKGEWIRGRGWDQNDWNDKRYPSVDELDAVVPDHPVFLTRVCGHVAFVNSMALRMAGITRETPDPDGGKILRRSDGSPSGILLDGAMELVEKKIDPVGKKEFKDLVLRAVHECLSVGLVGVHEMGIGKGVVDAYMELYRDEMLPFRITAYYSGDADDLDSLLGNEPIRGAFDYSFSLIGVKFYADGSLGGRSAALLDDYSDDPGNRGILVTSPETLYARIERVHRAGYQVAVHAIGDRANRLVLDIIERVGRYHPLEDARFRIEHAQVVSPEDIPRFAGLGVIPSMQFTHATSDMPWAGQRLGAERLKGAYAWRSFRDSGCTIPGGSDFPVESINPFYGIYAAVTRKDMSGEPARGWFPEQCLTVEEAVRAFTVDAAYAAFQENITGSIERGKLADFIVLSEDVMKTDPSRVPHIRVLATVLGGRVVYKADDFDIPRE